MILPDGLRIKTWMIEKPKSRKFKNDKKFNVAGNKLE